MSLRTEAWLELMVLMPLNTCSIGLSELTSDAIIEQSVAVQARNITLYCASVTRGAIYGSVSGVSIPSRNLLDNAIPDTQTDDRVVVDLRNHNHGAVLIVADNGRGIATTEWQRMFDRFHPGADTMSSGRGPTVQVNFPMPLAA